MTADPTPITDTVDLTIHTIDGEQACIYRCLSDGKHQAACPCHDTCPDHEDHCDGCAPRPAHDDSLLCGSCYYRRLMKPLRRLPALYDWLTSRKSGLKATAYDNAHVSGSKEQPLLFNPDIVQTLRVMDLQLEAWVRFAAQHADPGPGLDTHDGPAAAKWLEDRAGWISNQPWLVTLVHDLRSLERRARQLAPWQPTRHQLPLPCLRCEQQTLVLFGGEDWVTCVQPGCDNVISWARYDRLAKAIAEVRRPEVG